MRWIFILIAMCLYGCSHTNPSDSISNHYSFKRIHQISPNAPLIIIDPGHGGFDHGSHSKVCEEKKICLSTSLILKNYLNALGFRVELTRSKDVFIPLKERASMANQAKCALFISVHYNAAKNKNAHGIEVFYYGKEKSSRAKSSKKLAQCVLAKLLAHTGAISRGVKSGNFCVIRETKMPAILVEGGFITNPKEVRLLSDNYYLEKIAKSIAEGIDKYYKT